MDNVREQRPTSITVVGWIFMAVAIFLLLFASLQLLSTPADLLLRPGADTPHAVEMRTSLRRMALVGRIWAGAQGAASLFVIVAALFFLRLKAWARAALEVVSWLWFALVMGFGGLWLSGWARVTVNMSGRWMPYGLAAGLLYLAIPVVPTVVILKFLRGARIRQALGVPERNSRAMTVFALLCVAAVPVTALLGWRGFERLLRPGEVERPEMEESALPLPLLSEGDVSTPADGAAKEGERAVPADSQSSPLIKATRNGDLETVKQLLQAGTDIDAVYFRLNVTLLHVAAAEGHVEVVKYLLTQGADVHTINRDGMTPLHCGTAGTCHIEDPGPLLAHGKRPAANPNLTSVVRLLLAAGAEVDATSRYGHRPLHLAAAFGRPEILDELLSAGADLKARDELGRQALHWAARRDHPAVVARLLEAGAKPDERGSGGGTALHAAASANSLKVTQLLLSEGADVNATDDNGRTALAFAVAMGHKEVTELLLSNGALHDVFSASGLGAIDVLRALLDAEPSLVSKVRPGFQKAETPLLWAVRNQREEAVALLLSVGADANADIGDGYTALRAAARNGDGKIVDTLLKAGADPNARSPRPLHSAPPQEFGMTPLHFASRHGDAILVGRLLAAGADPNLKEEEVGTALHIAARDGHGSVVNALLTCGADVDARDGFEATPLHLASIWHNEIIPLLLAHGASANVTDLHGNTPLHYVALMGQKEAAQVLLASGARANARNLRGQTPLAAAKHRGHKGILQLLREHGARE